MPALTSSFSKTSGPSSSLLLLQALFPWLSLSAAAPSPPFAQLPPSLTASPSIPSTPLATATPEETLLKLLVPGASVPQAPTPASLATTGSFSSSFPPTPSQQLLQQLFPFPIPTTNVFGPSTAEAASLGEEPLQPIRKGLRRALVVGINYVGSRYELAGCINDALDVSHQLRAFFPSCEDVRVITDYTLLQPTREELLRGFEWLVQGLKPGEHVLFHYSGHGGRVRDLSGDEVSGLDSCLNPIRNRSLEVILDDEVRVRLADRIPPGSKCLMILDCCHSGTAADLPFVWRTPTPGEITYEPLGRYVPTAGTVVALSSCLDAQVAMDTRDDLGRPCGALTMALLRAWQSYGPAIQLKKLLWDVRDFLARRGFRQVPQLCSGTLMDVNLSFDLRG